MLGVRPKERPRVDLIHVLKSYNWAEGQKDDPVIIPIKEALWQQRWPNRRERTKLLPEKQKLMKEAPRLVLRDKVVYRRIMFPHDSTVTWQVVLSRAQARPVAERIHVEGGHWGVHKTFAWFKRQAMCVGLFQMVEEVCQRCPICSVTKGSEAQVPPMIWSTKAPLEALTIDFLTLDMSDDGYRHVLVMVDHFTKFAGPCQHMTRRPRLRPKQSGSTFASLMAVLKKSIRIRVPVSRVSSSRSGVGPRC